MTTIHEVSTSFLEDTKEDAETGNSAWQILKDNKIANEIKDHKYIQFTKGAAEMVLERCTYYIENGEVKKLTKEAKEKNHARKMKAFSQVVLDLICAGKD